MSIIKLSIHMRKCQTQGKLNGSSATDSFRPSAPGKPPGKRDGPLPFAAYAQAFKLVSVGKERGIVKTPRLNALSVFNAKSQYGSKLSTFHKPDDLQRCNYYVFVPRTAF